jgi:hypothetical protein
MKGILNQAEPKEKTDRQDDMKGDFSRIRFNPAKQYSAVLKQQGRVDLDADANEQCFIDVYQRELANADVIGRYGGPEHDAGFAIEITGDEILIGPGRYYVEGILVENPGWMHYDRQPYLVDPADSAQQLLQTLTEGEEGTVLQFVLEVWQRLATDLDDPCLREPALGQADTTARLQTVWRVVGSVSQPGNEWYQGGKAESGPIAQLSPCCQLLYNQELALAHTGEMGAGTAQGGNDCGCQPVAAAGYQGLENQLYRVEIHTAGDLNTATFKWSRENGSVVAQVTAVGSNSPTITVASLGPDANLGFQTGQWVELSDDSSQFGQPPNQPGALYKILEVNQANLQVTMTAPVVGLDPAKNARMRRWDQTGSSATAQGVPLSATPIPLENGIEVDFRKGQFQAGDYWTIPARTANGQIDWPPCGSNGKHFQPASYMPIDRAPLACVRPRADYNAAESKTGTAIEDGFLVNDCRLLFPPLTELDADTAPAALHITAISWTNDDVMTVDALLEKGFWVTFDQATTCPWGGGNFKVTLELPYLIGDVLAQYEGKLPGITKPTFTSPPGTDCFLRAVMALDPPWGITVSGATVNWIAAVTSAAGKVNYGAYEVLGLLNTLLGWLNPTGLARVRVNLIGGAIYASGSSGNIYLDGLSFGVTGSRSVDASECVNLSVPSGNSLAASDYEGWFYLAPTVLIANVVIQGLNNGQETTIKALKVLVDSNNQVTSYQIGESATVTQLQALITLTYPPIAPVPVALLFTGAGAGTVVTIAASVTIPIGQTTYATPIAIPVNPGAVTDTVTLVASVTTAVGPLPFNPAPTLAITGMTPPVNTQ